MSPASRERHHCVRINAVGVFPVFVYSGKGRLCTYGVNFKPRGEKACSQNLSWVISVIYFSETEGPEITV